MSAVSIWDDLADPLGERLADDLRAMVRQYDAGAARSGQRDLGPSEIGAPCTRCIARKVLGLAITGDFNDPWCAVVGTAVHAWLDEAAAFDNAQALVNADKTARWRPEQRVQPHPDLLPSGGKADLYDEVTKTVIDHKTTSAERLRKYRLNGPGPQYRVQAHVYGLGYARTGVPVEHVAVAFWNRGGKLRDLYVWTEPYDVDLAMNALKRYRTIRDQARAIGPALIPLLPADQSCFDCGGKDVTDDELQRLTAAASTTPNPA